jgi:hypothetical protein
MGQWSRQQVACGEQRLNPDQVNAIGKKLQEERQESGVPYGLIRDLLWTAADATFSRADFVGLIADRSDQRTILTINLAKYCTPFKHDAMPER